MPSDDVIATIRTELPNVDLRREHQKFTDHFRANGKPMKDWNAAWRNWMRRATTFAPRQNATDARQAMFDRWATLANEPDQTVIKGVLA